MNITLHQLFDWAGAIVIISSLLNAFLPPYEWFDKWPRFQIGYKIFTMIIVRWSAINLKSIVYQQISVQSQSKSNGGNNNAT